MAFGAGAAAAAASNADDGYRGKPAELNIVPQEPPFAPVSPSVQRLEKDLQNELSEKAIIHNLLTDNSEHWLVENPFFKGIVTVLVLVNAVLMGVEVDHPEWEDGWSICGHCFSAAFIVEACIKLGALRLAYFYDRWNLLDGVLALMGFFDTWFVTIIGGSNSGLKNFSILRTLRLLRLMRLARLFRQFGKLVIVLRSIKDAVESTCWVACILMMCIYVCAIFCVDFIGHAEKGMYPGHSKEVAVIDDQEIMANFNPHIVFGTMGNAMVSLFNVAILAEWTEIVRPVMLKQPAMVLFFITFSIFVCFGVMNVIIGMIVDTVIQNARALERELEEASRKEKVEILQELKSFVFTVERNGNYEIDMKELDRILLNIEGDKKIDFIMKKVSVPYGCSADEFLNLLDTDGDGKLQHEEFVQSLYRLINCTGFQQTCMVQMSVNKILRSLNEFTEVTNRRVQSLESAVGRVCEHFGLRPMPQQKDEPDAKPTSEGHSASPISSLTPVHRPVVPIRLEAVCQEVSASVLSTLRQELALGLEKCLSIPKTPSAEPVSLSARWEVIEDELRKLPTSGEPHCNGGEAHTGGVNGDVYPINAPDSPGGDEGTQSTRVVQQSDSHLPVQAARPVSLNQDGPDRSAAGQAATSLGLT